MAPQGDGRVAPFVPVSPNSQPPVLSRPVVLLFGDSLTERSMDAEGGWGAALAHHFARKVDVVNRGFGGYNSRWGRHLLAPILGQLAASGARVALMTVWWGANDAAIPGRSAGRQAVPVAEFAANLEAMVGAARRAGVARILLITPPPVGDAQRVDHMHAQQRGAGQQPTEPLPDRSLAHAGSYAAAVRDVGARLGLPVVDAYAGLQSVPGWQTQLLDDGLHFTPAGSRKVWELVREAITRAFPDLGLNLMPNQMPWHSQWDAAAPDAFWAAQLAQMQAREAAQPGNATKSS